MRGSLKMKGGKTAVFPLSKNQVLHELQSLIFMIIGVAAVALGYVLFQLPYNIAAGGVSGIAIIVSQFVDWPIGLLYWVLNIPMLALGFIYLGRWPFLLRTLIASTLFSIFTDIFNGWLPHVLSPYPVSNDLLLSTVYGGIIGGIGGGFIYRAGSTMGGTGVVGRIIQNKTGLPLSQSYLFTDGTIILVAALLFGWEIGMYALIMLVLNGLASDYVLEGPSSTRTATIVTNYPQEMVQALTDRLHRGVSYWEITGGYTGQKRYMVVSTIYRPQVNDVKRVVADVDPHAFLTIGVAHQAMGNGFGAFPRSTT